MRSGDADSPSCECVAAAGAPLLARKTRISGISRCNDFICLESGIQCVFTKLMRVRRRSPAVADSAAENVPRAARTHSRSQTLRHGRKPNGTTTIGYGAKVPDAGYTRRNHAISLGTASAPTASFNESTECQSWPMRDCKYLILTQGGHGAGLLPRGEEPKMSGFGPQRPRAAQVRVSPSP